MEAGRVLLLCFRAAGLVQRQHLYLGDMQAPRQNRGHRGGPVDNATSAERLRTRAMRPSG